MAYRIGLDIGIASVGWAAVEDDIDGNPIRIIDLGSRIFEKAEVPKTGASLAAPRRMARSARRRIRRRRFRKERIKQLFEDVGLISISDLEDVFNNGTVLSSVYSLRYEALERALSNEEFARVLLHLSQRRGYKSNSKAEESADKERGKLLEAVESNRVLMANHDYRTVGEMLWKDEKFRGVTHSAIDQNLHTPRNKAESYANTLPRELLVDEIHAIFSAQRSFGAKFATKEFEDEYTQIYVSQRSFDDGPGGESPYAGSQIEKMVGMDKTFELDDMNRPTQPRAAKASFTFEYFKLLEDINHIRIVRKDGASGALSPDQREVITALAFKTADVKYSKIRKALSLSEDERFNTVNYGSNTIEEDEKQAFKQMQSYHKVRKAVESKVGNSAFAAITHEQLDEIGRILSLYRNDEKRTAQLTELGLDNSIIQAILPLILSGWGKLSILAMKKIIPFLEQGLTYDKACAKVYGYHTRQGSEQRVTRLNIDKHCEEISNPVVRRSVAQTIKVVNAIVREYGAPELVCIELAREMNKNYDERRKIEKENKENRDRNEAAAKQIEEYKGARPTGEDIVKFKLFKEQDGVCLYSGENLDVARLFEPGYVDVDHIIPYSKCFDNSYRNKVLVKSSENRQKGNRIPAEYLTGEKWDKFETTVNSRIKDYRKRERLLKKTLTAEDAEGFKERNLTDTKYISRVVYNMINDNMAFAEHPRYKKKVIAVNGAVTAYVRGRWGINKLRGDGDLHHAVDAVVISCISDGMINRISRYSENKEQYYLKDAIFVDDDTGEVLSAEQYREKKEFFPEPWRNFRKELDARLSNAPDVAIAELRLPSYAGAEPPKPVFVSRAPNRKVSGAAHMDTIRSAKKEGYTVTKTGLADLKLKNGEIEGYYNPESDRLLYDALKARLALHGGNAKKAFAEPFYKPRSDGSQGPLVKKVKISEKCSMGVSVNSGIAGNGSMIRVDIFHVEDDGYYFVPIYVADTVLDKLPNRAVVSGKPSSEWKVMSNGDFVCSIYPGDLIKITSNNGFTLQRTSEEVVGEPEIIRKEALLYFVKAGISTGSFSVKTHDNRYEKGSLGIKTLAQIEKYDVDVLGNCNQVSLPEKRLGFDNHRRA